MKCELSISVVDGEPTLSFFDGEALVMGELTAEQLHLLIQQAQKCVVEIKTPQNKW